MFPILLTLVAAFTVGYALDRLRVPGGMMIGAVIGACLLGVTTGISEMPKAAKITAQIIAGGFIGSGVSRQELHEMKTVARPAAILLPYLLIVNVIAGVLIYLVSPLDLITALLCCTPGGINDIPMIAADLGADASKVLIMQFIRFMMGIALFPALIRLQTGSVSGKEDVIKRTEEKPKWLPVLLTLIVAAGFGLLGNASPIPSGTMAFSVLGSILFKFIYPKAQVPRTVRKVAQCLAGAYVGAGIGILQILEIPYLVLPIVILLACYLIGALCASTCFEKTKCFTHTEAMLAATPAGASDMALISADLGIRNIKLILLQILRLIIVISFFPTILSFISAVFSI